jgi:hypothetical protein
MGHCLHHTLRCIPSTRLRLGVAAPGPATVAVSADWHAPAGLSVEMRRIGRGRQTMLLRKCTGGAIPAHRGARGTGGRRHSAAGHQWCWVLWSTAIVRRSAHSTYECGDDTLERGTSTSVVIGRRATLDYCKRLRPLTISQVLS